MGTANDLIKQAQRYVGCGRGGSGHRDILNTYNNYKPGRGYKVQSRDAWCATFVSAMAIKSDNGDLIPQECSCQLMINLARNRGIWIENDNYLPKPGDIVMYDWQDSGYGDNTGWADHVGIVEKVNGNRITVIEGNKGGAVGRRVIVRNQRYIRGYIKPNYTQAANSATIGHSKTNRDVAKEVLAGKWGNNPTRKKRLEAAGYNYAAVQAEVNKLSGSHSKPTSKPKYHVAVDGWTGKNDITALQKIFGCKHVDGVISGQPRANQKYHVRFSSLRYGRGGSNLVAAMQRKIGAKVDRYLGYDTVGKWQQFLVNQGFNIAVDHYWGAETAKATQRWINTQNK